MFGGQLSAEVTFPCTQDATGLGSQVSWSPFSLPVAFLHIHTRYGIGINSVLSKRFENMLRLSSKTLENRTISNNIRIISLNQMKASLIFT